jgi:hypothetical protein
MMAIMAGADAIGGTNRFNPGPNYLDKLKRVLGARGVRIGLDRTYLETATDAVSDLPRVLGCISPFNVSGCLFLMMPCAVARIGMPNGLPLIGRHQSQAALLGRGTRFRWRRIDIFEALGGLIRYRRSAKRYN